MEDLYALIAEAIEEIELGEQNERLEIIYPSTVATDRYRGFPRFDRPDAESLDADRD